MHMKCHENDYKVIDLILFCFVLKMASRAGVPCNTRDSQAGAVEFSRRTLLYSLGINSYVAND